MGSLGNTLVSPVSIGFACVHTGAPKSLRVHWLWRGFTFLLLGIAGFIGFRVGSLVRAKGSPD